jgi:hypothetical protein
MKKAWCVVCVVVCLVAGLIAPVGAGSSEAGDKIQLPGVRYYLIKIVVEAPGGQVGQQILEAEITVARSQYFSEAVQAMDIMAEMVRLGFTLRSHATMVPAQ